MLKNKKMSHLILTFKKTFIIEEKGLLFHLVYGTLSWRMEVGLFFMPKKDEAVSQTAGNTLT